MYLPYIPNSNAGTTHDLGQQMQQEKDTCYRLVVSFILNARFIDMNAPVLGKIKGVGMKRCDVQRAMIH
jgi:hypothetical protein